MKTDLSKKAVTDTQMRNVESELAMIRHFIGKGDPLGMTILKAKLAKLGTKEEKMELINKIWGKTANRKKYYKELI